MKKILISALLFTISFVSAFAQLGDARVSGMAGSFTSIADDQNALLINPAGLPFLSDSYLFFDAAVNFELTKNIMYGQEKYPSVYESGMESGEFSYYDTFFGADVPFDPSVYGFTYDASDDVDYRRAVRKYQEFRAYYTIYDFAQNTSDIFVLPRIGFVNKYWGATAFSRNRIDINTVEYNGRYTEYGFDVIRDTGAVAGFGIGLGLLSLGANLKAFTHETNSYSYLAREIDESAIATILFESNSEPAFDFELGVGSILTFGNLSAGAYIDNLLAFIDFTGQETDVDFLGIFEGLNIGASFDFVESKLSDQTKFLIFRTSVDLLNLGSYFNRSISAGLEIGFDFIALSAVARAGYRQAIIGELSNIIEAFEPKYGYYTVGLGTHFLFLHVDISAEFPYDMVFTPPVAGFIPTEILETQFADFKISASIEF